MSVGELGENRDGASDRPPDRFAAELDSDEDVRFSWTATGVRWANQSTVDIATPATFAATDRRVLFETDESTSSIGYDRMRAVKTDPATDGLDASTAFLGCGGLCLLVGVVVALEDFANGVGLVVLSVALLIVGGAMDHPSGEATVTIIVGNERQRLSFSADERVGADLAALADEGRYSPTRDSTYRET